MPEIIHVAVVGPSGSGKTWLARSIASALGQGAAYITLDDFYRDLSHLKPEERSAVNFDDPATIDWGSVRAVMDALSAGRTAAVPDYDFATHTRKSSSRPVEPREWVIWDGLWLLHEPWLRQCFGLGVFVDCQADERLARRLARDVQERGRTPESVRLQFQHHVEPMSRKFVEPQRQWASCRVSSPLTEATLADLLCQIRALKSQPHKAERQERMSEGSLPNFRTAIRFEPACSLQAVRQAVKAARAWLAEQHLLREELDAWELMLAEGCNNAVEHAPESARALPVRLDLSCGESDVEAQITDHTAGFDFGAQADVPDLDNEGSRGLLLIKSLADQAEYWRSPGRNVLFLRKQRSASAAPKDQTF